MKMVGVAKIVSVAAVTAKLLTYGDTYTNGMIFVEIPELGYTAPNYVLCRYALSIPFAQIKVGQKIWVEPTVGTKERWVYTGYVDCMTNASSSSTELNLYVDGSQYIKFTDDGKILIKGDLEIDGAVDIVGNTTIDGTVEATGDVSSEAEVTALSAGTSVSLSTHTHPYVDTPAGPATTSAPTPGS